MNLLTVLLLTIVSLTACQSTNMQQAHGPGEEGGLGGTGVLANTDSGLGGTGKLAATNSGLGGTGIIGEITGFGSIFVNGAEVELDEKTAYFVDGISVEHYQPAIGEVVALRATDGASMMHATELHVQHQVIGAAEDVDNAQQQFRVLGQIVAVDNPATLPREGDRVQVSGFRDSSNIVHSSLIKPADQPVDMLVGPLEQTGNGWRIADQAITLPAALAVNPGDVVRLRGKIKQGVFTAASATTLRALPFSQPVEKLLLQGYVGSADLRAYGVHLNPAGQGQAGNMIWLELQRTENHWLPQRQLDGRSLPHGSPVPVMPNRVIQPAPGRPLPDRPLLPDTLPMPGRLFR